MPPVDLECMTAHAQAVGSVFTKRFQHRVASAAVRLRLDVGGPRRPHHVSLSPTGMQPALLAHSERMQEAHAILQRFLQARTIGEPHDETCMPIVVALLETAVLLKDAEAAHRLVEPLKIVANLVCVDNSMTVVARHLGAAMNLLGDRTEAIAYTRQATEVAEKVRFRPELALARLQLAELHSVAPDRSLLTELESMDMQPALARARALSH
jgi:hypothetical protein